MNTEQAKLLLESLMDRIERDAQSGKRRLVGPISEQEFRALRVMAGVPEGAPVEEREPGSVAPSDSRTPDAAFGSARVPERVELVLASLDFDSPQDEPVTLCLDFGTAMSKAVAMGEDQREPVLLPLADIAGEPNRLFPVSSTLYFGRGGKVYFGHEAIATSLNEDEADRERFDSPKQYMSQGDFETLAQDIVNKAVNPSEFSFTTMELITLYLSYLTDLACSALSQEELSRYVRRRFAMPSWDRTRANLADRHMTKILAKAQILADTFHGSWRGGLDVADARYALDAVENLPALPVYLIHGGVREAVAAASGTLRSGEGIRWGGKGRRLFMVVDAGAGTTDYELFVATQFDGSDGKTWYVPNTNVALRQGGDTIDRILLHHILEKEKIAFGGAEYSIISRYLQRRIRDLKESLFRDGRVRYTLPDDTEGYVDKNEFLRNERVSKFSETIKEYFAKSLEEADPSWFERDPGDARAMLYVVLTGGGAGLPMIEALLDKTTVHGVELSVRCAPAVPKWFIDRYSSSANEYRQLAVAVGGSAESLPEEGGQFAIAGFGDTQKPELESGYKS